MDTTNLRADAPSDDSRAFDLAERVLDRLRAGAPADLSAECRDCPELLPQVRSLVEAAAGLEGLRVQMATGGGPPTGYELVREIARGGMGVVYEARQLRLNRTVAFKRVLNADPSGLLRFLAEAEAIAAVRHPNVVQVYESGQHDGQPYLAMEFCPGGTLAARLKDGGRLTPKAAAELMAQVAAGVAAAHAEGIVHRDLKPGNVLFDAAGMPKVADFGLAKRGTGADLTHTQAVMGTPAYMSPEQARGETKFVGPTADVWALGVMLYECLTGKRPFDGANQLELLEQVKSGVVAGVRSSQRDVPRDVELIVQKCLAKEPAERYPTAAELAADLGNWLAGKPITAKPAGAITRGAKWVRRNRVVAGSLAAAMMAMAVGTGLSLWQAGEARFQEKEASDKAIALGVALDDKTTAEQEAQAKTGQLKLALEDKTKAEDSLKQETVKLSAQLRESNRRLDLNRLRDAQEAWDRNAVQLARDKLAEIAPENRCVVWGILNRRFAGGLFTLWGHTNGVTSVGFSPDGKRLVTGSWDGTARVWDAATGLFLLGLSGHTSAVKSVGFSPDGRQIVTGSNDQTARVWDAATGQSLSILQGHTGWVESVGFSPDGRQIVTGSRDKTARVWDVASGLSLTELTGHMLVVSSVGFSPDGKRLVTGSWDGTARVWDITTGQYLRELKGHSQDVTCVGFSPDGRRIVTGSGDGTARVWDAATGQSLNVLNGHTSALQSVGFSPDGRRIVTGGGEFRMPGVSRVWDTATGQSITELKGHTGTVESVGFSPDGRRIVTGSGDGTARVWDIAAEQSLTELKGRTSVGFSPDGKRLATGMWDRPAREWDATTGVSPTELKGQTLVVSSVKLSPDGTRIVTGSNDGTVTVRNAATEQNLFELKGHTQVVMSVAISPNGKRIVTGSRDKTARVWDVVTGRSVLELKGHADGVTGVAINPDGTRIATCSYDKTARVWDAATGRSVLELQGHTGRVLSVAFSPDGKRLVTSSDDKTTRVWDVTTGQFLTELWGHTDTLAFSADGKRIITWSKDHTTRVWDTATAQQLPEPAPATAKAGEKMPDGRLVVKSGDRLVVVDPRINPDFLARWRYQARSYPQQHAALAEQYKDDPFAAAVQRSLEQQARGRLAVEDLDFIKAQKHCLAALLLKPKPYQWPEVAPPPRLVK